MSEGCCILSDIDCTCAALFVWQVTKTRSIFVSTTAPLSKRTSILIVVDYVFYIEFVKYHVQVIGL